MEIVEGGSSPAVNEARVSPMNLSSWVCAAALSLVLLSSACSTADVDSPGEEFLGYAISVTAPDSVAQGETINVLVTGSAGCCCDHFEGIESQKVADRWILRPIGRRGRARAGGACTLQRNYFQAHIYLEAAASGWTHIEVQSAGPVLLDSTYVRP